MAVDSAQREVVGVQKNRETLFLHEKLETWRLGNLETWKLSEHQKKTESEIDV